MICYRMGVACPSLQLRGAKRCEDEAQRHRRHGRQSSTIYNYELALGEDMRWGPFLQKYEEKS